MEEDIEIIKVELSEENLIEPITIKFENGSRITIPVNTPEQVWRSNPKIMFLREE